MNILRFSPKGKNPFIELSDDDANELGEKFIGMLQLKHSLKEKDQKIFKTAWGTKTQVGIARSLVRIVADHFAEKTKKAED